MTTTEVTILPPGSSKRRGCQVQISGSHAVQIIGNLKRKTTLALKAAGIARDTFRYSDDGEHGHYVRQPDEQTLTHLGIAFRPGILIYSQEPNQYTSGAAHKRAQVSVYEMAAALVKADFKVEVQQNHSGHVGQILIWADENGFVI